MIAWASRDKDYNSRVERIEGMPRSDGRFEAINGDIYQQDDWHTCRDDALRRAREVLEGIIHDERDRIIRVTEYIDMLTAALQQL